MFKNVLKMASKTLTCASLVLLLCMLTSTIMAQTTVEVVESRCVNTGEIIIDGVPGGSNFTRTITAFPPAYDPNGTGGNGLSDGINDTIAALYPGVYTIEYRLANNSLAFTTTQTVAGTYVIPGNSDYQPVTTPVTNCINGATGTISGIMTNGRDDKEYTIISGPSGVGTSNSTGSFTGLLAGIYEVQAVDSCFNLQTRFVTVGNYTFSVSNPGLTSSSCNQFSLNSLTVTPFPVGGRYEIVNNSGTVLASGTSLPLSFTSSYNAVNGGQVFIRVKDACGDFISTPTSGSFGFFVSNPSISSTSCTNFSLNSLTVNPAFPAGGVYEIVNSSNTVIASGSSLPINFVSDKNAVANGLITIRVRDVCGNTRSATSSAITNDWTFTAVADHVACAGDGTGRTPGVVIDGITTTGFIPGPYKIEIIYYTQTQGYPIATETVPGNVFPYTLTGVTAATNPLAYDIKITDACGVEKIITKTKSYFASTSAKAFVDCTTGTVTVNITTETYNGPVTYSISPDPTGIGNTTNNVLTGLPDGNYTITATDICGKKATTDFSIDHNWKVGAGSDRNTCDIDKFRTYVSIPTRSIGQVTVTQYDGGIPVTGASTVLETRVWNNGNNGNANAGTFDAIDYLIYSNTIANQITTFVVTDACGKSDTIQVTNGPIGHQPLTRSIKVTPLCINIGNVSGSAISDFDSWNPVRFRLWPVSNPSNIIADVNTFTNIPTNVAIANNLGVGTYVVESSLIFCADKLYDTIIILPYTQPRINPALNFSCAPLGTGSGIFLTGSGGVAPYRFQVVSSRPSGLSLPQQISSTGVGYDIPGRRYTSVTFRITDACGNGTTKTVPFKAAPVPVIRASITNISGCTPNPTPFFLFIDSTQYGAATYEWRKTAGPGAGSTVLSTFGKLPLTIPTDYGTYSLRVSLGGTCYDKTVSYKVANVTLQTCVATIGNYVWADANGDGLQNEPDSLGINGIVINLYTPGLDGVPGGGDDVLVGTTTTANDLNDNPGYYSFDITTDGNYFVEFPTNLVGYTVSPQTTTPSTDGNSDNNPTTGFSPLVTINVSGGPSGGLNFTNPTIDAGFVPIYGSVGNYVWNDTNHDGIQNEPTTNGINGIEVELYDPGVDGIANTDDDLLIASTVTANDGSGNPGYYNFESLTSGNYFVQFPTSSQSGDYITLPTLTAQTDNNSDADITTGISPIFTINTLGAGQDKDNTSIDAGYFLPSSIGNFIWNDLDGNGIQDNGELGLPNVTVNLYGSDGVTIIATTTTDSNGGYIFNNLVTGNYFVGVVPPSGYFVSPATQGGNTNTDSDIDPTTEKSSVINLGVGDNNLSIDGGLFQLASIGNKVWLDNNSNGSQDAGEPGVAGIAVNLYNNTNQLVGTTITDAYGNYLFNNLILGNYSVEFTLPSNYTFTTANNAGDNGDDSNSDVNVLTGKTSAFTLTSGEIELTADAGIKLTTQPLTSSIGDKVWFDLDGNGNQDAGEPGVSGVTITLFDGGGSVIAITTTDANGNYIFTNLPNGTYSVGISTPGGTVLTSSTGTTDGNGTTNSDFDPTTLRTGTITISTPGTVITGIDAGLKTDNKGTVGDFVWNDLNQNGIQDAGEPGIQGVTMRLYDCGADGLIGGSDDILIATTTTDVNGYYVFTNLDPIKFFVVATPVAGYTRTSANAGGDDTRDNDFVTNAAYPGSFVTARYFLGTTPGGLTRDMTIDLGMYNTTVGLNSLGDKVWNDMDADGVQDVNEQGMANITVRLLDASGNPVNNPATGKPYVTVTDVNGNYSFVDLPDGNYIVEFANLPVGFSFTTPNANGTSGNDDTADSDANTVSGRTGVIALDATSASLVGVNNTSVDAGIIATASATASIGDKVWYDLNGNGKQDAGELGVAGVTVTLLDGTGNTVNIPNTSTPYVVTTNGLGEYIFTGLPAGDYRVQFSNLPVGYTSSIKDGVANDDTQDSDGAAWIGSSTNSTTSTTDVITVNTGEEVLSLDMGIVPAAGTNTIGDFVWLDANSNGTQDGTEIGVSGVMITLFTNGADGLPNTLDDQFVGTTTTNSNGQYIFTGLPDGLYNIVVSNVPNGMSFTTQTTGTNNGSDVNASGNSGTIDLDNGGVSAVGVSNLSIDAGLVTTKAVLGNYVWFDANMDGVQDASEAGIPGVTVILYGSDGTTIISSTITGANGQYLFTNLDAGNYVVGFGTLPNNLEFTQQNAAGDNQNNTNSDANPSTGKTGVINLTAGEVELTIDAGVRTKNPASVGDYVWIDVNKDGFQTTGEFGLPGVIVTLFDAANNPVGAAVTDGKGKYLISNVTPGNGYYIVFSNLPTTSQFTLQTSNVLPNDNTLGSDANVANGTTASFNLAAGQYLPSVDAGVVKVQVLPVQLQNFTAVAQINKVLVSWEVAAEINMANYVVEHSVDGINFTAIGTVAANNRSNYSLLHATPVSGVNYYRLVSIDNENKQTYSPVRKVLFDKFNGISIYPNPVKVKANITFTGAIINKQVNVNISSMDGKLVIQQRFNAVNATETIDVSKLANGKYTVQFITDSATTTQVIEVIR